MKENQDKVTAKINELTETVTAANGSILVIGLIKGGDESCVIAAVKGKPVMITEAIAKLVSNDNANDISKMLKEGLSLAALYKIAGCHADKVEVKEETSK